MKHFGTLFVGVIAVVALFITLTKDSTSLPPSGGTAGPLYTEYQEFDGGVKYGNSVATSSSGNVTMSGGDLRAWIKADVVVYNALGAATNRTITFAASSTIPDVLPQAGDMAKTCVYNATSGPSLVLAGGTGVDLNVSSSSATALGSTVIGAGEIGCITWVRKTVTSSAFDIGALFSSFK